MALVTKQKKIKLVVIIIFIFIIATTVFWAGTYPHRSTLIMTPSSHEKIEYLQIENNRLGNSKIEFAIYDEECDYYEICFSDAQALFSERDKLNIYLDSKKLEEYSFIRHTSFWKDNTIIIFNNTPKFQKLTIDYAGKTATLLWKN